MKSPKKVESFVWQVLERVNTFNQVLRKLGKSCMIVLQCYIYVGVELNNWAIFYGAVIIFFRFQDVSSRHLVFVWLGLKDLAL